MNQFVNRFGDTIANFWDKGASEAEKQKTITDILAYANLNPQKFKAELREVLFNPELDPLSVVLEALSKDTDTWGDFFVQVLDDIFDAAYATDKADGILFNLAEFYYIENDTRPFVQKIADRLLKELDSPRVDIRIEVIKNITGYLLNSSVKNKLAITNRLIDKLDDDNWKVRCVTFQYLAAENLLPQGAKLKLSDKLLGFLVGHP
ncbi:hypothetical protein ACFFGT_28185 [Mucilaginibacter angelicae]|uniref:HEAT repeat domain-containing protein n=1 Tax=Mucilaginibacter angelicae TaxID=869718 RepID=A0ABV6LF75_9SPHI